MPALLVPILATMAIWNLLTDWTWIGNILGVMPEEDKKDINKRAISITKLLDSAKSIVYSAQKDRRRVNQQEKELIQDSATLAKKEIEEMVSVYEKKFTLFGKPEVIRDLHRTRTNLLMQISNMEQMAGIAPRKPVKQQLLTGTVVTVIDGDTITIRPTGLIGPRIEVMVRLVGIDAPESTTKEGEESKKYLKERIEGKYVKIESDPQALTDMYGRRLGVIYQGAENINVWMLKNGYATFYEFEPNALVFKKQWKAASDNGKIKKRAYARVGAISAPTTPLKPQIFTGVLTQGSLGDQIPDNTREADLIETQDELEEAARNNLAAFLISLPGAIRYVISFKTRVITKDGYERRSQRIKVITGYFKNGNPKYKTYLNKFAVLKLYFWTDTHRRVKLKELNLGPVNAITFNPKPAELDDLANTIRKTILTQDIKEISNITTPQDVTVVSPQLPVSPDSEDSKTDDLSRADRRPEDTPKVEQVTATIPTPETQPGERLYKSTETNQIIASLPSEISHKEKVHRTKYIPYTPPTPPTEEEPERAEVKLPYSNNPNRCNALSISKFFDINKKKFPNLSTRANWYEIWGLGPSATYIGTAEQNNKLLREIKRSIGCKI